MKKIQEVNDFIQEASDSHQEILRTLRDLIAETLPEVTEEYKWSRPVYSTQKSCCYLQSNKNHVNLGFMNFEKITTGSDLLEGTGKQMRHVKIKTTSDIKKDVFKKMIYEVGQF